MPSDAWGQFIVNVLKKNGATNAHSLLGICTTTTDPPNCPKDLKTATVDQLHNFLTSSSNLFTIKHEEVCLNQYETKLRELLKSFLGENDFVKFSEIHSEAFLKKCDKATTAYIKADKSWAQGVVNFIARNDDLFILLKENVYLLSLEQKVNADDYEAVMYFSKFLEKQSLTCTQLAGHWNQAPKEVKNVITSTNSLVFCEFLKRNSFVFDVDGQQVTLKKHPGEHAQDDAVSKTVSYFYEKINAKRGKGCDIKQLAGYLSQKSEGQAVIIGTIGGKASPEAIKEFLLKHMSVFQVGIDDNVSILKHPQREAYATNAANSVVTPIQTLSDFAATSNTSTSSTIVNVRQNLSSSTLNFTGTDDTRNTCVEMNQNPPSSSLNSNGFGDLKVTSNENSEAHKGVKETLRNLFGVMFLSSLERLLTTANIKDYTKIKTIAFDVGKAPLIKLASNDAKLKYSTYELSDQSKVDGALLKQILEHKDIVRFLTTLFGVRDSLHVIRLMKRDDDIVGMTLMLQSHAPSSISSFEEKQLRNLCFIIYDPAECMNDVIHSYLRSLAQIRSQRDHVFIVDRDGGICGYGHEPPPVIGNSRCIHTEVYASNRAALLEAYRHQPDYIVTNCLHPVDRQALQTMKDISAQGVQIITTMSKHNEHLLDSIA
ncbi:uncharacterized protein LOC143452850 [Clavelina lepadiformis]|uniref:Egal-1 winged helix domain-containing protein n=1 Tax=Clavelina lepadiformis TaxID=159417 RepID=A0ABP0GV68_CLALP